MYVCVFPFTNITVFLNDIVLALIVPSCELKGTHFTQVYNPDGFHDGKNLLFITLLSLTSLIYPINNIFS